MELRIKVSEPYRDKQIMENWRIAPTKKVAGQIIALTGLRLVNRGTWIIHPRTRACPKHCIIEVTVTDEKNIVPGTKISSVMYLGFVEITEGGLIIAGQPVTIQGGQIGEVAGFSDIHYPNHLNVIVTANDAFASEYIKPYANASNANLKYKLDDKVVFVALE